MVYNVKNSTSIGCIFVLLCDSEFQIMLTHHWSLPGTVSNLNGLSEEKECWHVVKICQSVFSCYEKKSIVHCRFSHSSNTGWKPMWKPNLSQKQLYKLWNHGWVRTTANVTFLQITHQFLIQFINIYSPSSARLKLVKKQLIN